jgi:hypothetical protein
MGRTNAGFVITALPFEGLESEDIELLAVITLGLYGR